MPGYKIYGGWLTAMALTLSFIYPIINPVEEGATKPNVDLYEKDFFIVGNVCDSTACLFTVSA